MNSTLHLSWDVFPFADTDGDTQIKQLAWHCIAGQNAFPTNWLRTNDILHLHQRAFQLGTQNSTAYCIAA